MQPIGSEDPLGIAGQVIAGKYQIERLLDVGGHAMVYRANHAIWNQPVAIKLYHTLGNAPAEARDALFDEFVQEGKLMAALSSRSAAIVQARDIGTFTTPGGVWMPYMVLEWLDGHSLAVVVDRERLAGLEPRGLHEAMALLEPVAVALEIAHQQGVAHRDVKPENLFVIGDARAVGVVVKLVDFGVAKVMSSPAATALSAQTGVEITSFTPRYGAPEQFSRRYGATGPWTDVFALALVLLEVLRGGVPVFEGDDFMQLAEQSWRADRRPTPRALGLGVSSAVEAVLARALAVAPADRYASAGAFWAALHQAVFPDGSAWSAGLHDAASIDGAASRALSSLAPPTPRAAPKKEAPTIARDGSGAIASPFSPSGPPASDAAPAAGPVAGAPGPRRGAGLWAAVAIASVVAFAAGGAVMWRVFARAAPAPPAPSALAPSPPTTASGSASPPSIAGPATCPATMALVPGGRFFMGSDDAAFKLWQPAHKVALDAYCIDRTEVTVAAYRACVDKGACAPPLQAPSYPKAPGTPDAAHAAELQKQAELCNYDASDRDRHPVNCVTWAHADAYCRAAGARLPTEAEWEYAARGSDGRVYPWGDDPGSADRMNACGAECRRWELAHRMSPSPTMYDVDDGWPGTAPVGSFPKGRTLGGADDFVGNVWEWTGDWFATYKADEVVNPTGAPAGDRKAIRGGGFNGGVALWLNPAFRYHQLATAAAPAIGFRCAKSLR